MIEDTLTRKLHILNAVGRYCERLSQNKSLENRKIERLINSAAEKVQ